MTIPVIRYLGAEQISVRTILAPFHTGCGVSFAFPNGTIHTGPATDYFRLQFRYTTI